MAARASPGHQGQHIHFLFSFYIFNCSGQEQDASRAYLQTLNKGHLPSSAVRYARRFIHSAAANANNSGEEPGARLSPPLRNMVYEYSKSKAKVSELTGLVAGRPPGTINLPPIGTRIVRFKVADWNRLRLRESLLLAKGLGMMRIASVDKRSGGNAGISYIVRAQMLVNAPIMLQVSAETEAKHKKIIASIDSEIRRKYPKALEDQTSFEAALLDIYGTIDQSGINVPVIITALLPVPKTTEYETAEHEDYDGDDSMTDGPWESRESLQQEKPNFPDNKYTAELIIADGGYGLQQTYATSTIEERPQKKLPEATDFVAEAIKKNEPNADILFLDDKLPDKFGAPIFFPSKIQTERDDETKYPARKNRFLEDAAMQTKEDVFTGNDSADDALDDTFFQEAFEFDSAIDGDEITTVSPPASER